MKLSHLHRCSGTRPLCKTCQIRLRAHTKRYEKKDFVRNILLSFFFFSKMSFSMQVGTHKHDSCVVVDSCKRARFLLWSPYDTTAHFFLVVVFPLLLTSRNILLLQKSIFDFTRKERIYQHIGLGGRCCQFIVSTLYGVVVKEENQGNRRECSGDYYGKNRGKFGSVIPFKVVSWIDELRNMKYVGPRHREHGMRSKM